MIIDCIGCLHGVRPKLEGGDLLIVTGDLTSHDEEEQHFAFNEWLEKQPYKKIILIAGNHDTWIEKNECAGFSDYDGQKVEYLCDSGTEFEGLKIWGSPWTAQFKGINPKCTAFTVKNHDHTEEVLSECWNKIPLNTDILVTHGPPFGIFDRPNRDQCVGSQSLLEKVLELKPRLHVFSHIHEEGGKQVIFKRPGYGDENNTRFVNCSIMSDNYRPDNEPIRVIL